MTIVVLGSINMDLTTYAPRLPAAGETLLGSAYRLVAGGKGFNQAVAAGRLGAPTHFVGRVGRDPFGEAVLAQAGREPVDLSGVARDDEHGTGLAVIGVDERGENAITVIPGANMVLDAADVDRAAAALTAGAGRQALLLQLESPLEASLAASERAAALGAVVILDPAPARSLPETAYRLAAVMTPNEVEAELLTGIRPARPAEAARAASVLRARGLATAVIKMGGRGVYFQTAGADGFIPPFAVDVVDTVAAGDAFNGALAVALVEGRTLAEAVRWGAAAGALATTKPGASAAMPGRDALLALLANDPPDSTID